MTFQQTSCFTFQCSNKRLLLKTGIYLGACTSYFVPLNAVLISLNTQYHLTSEMEVTVEHHHSPKAKTSCITQLIVFIYFHVWWTVVSFDTATKTGQIKSNVSPKLSPTFYTFWTQEKFLHQQYLLARNLTSCIEKQNFFCLLWAWHFSCIWQ